MHARNPFFVLFTFGFFGAFAVVTGSIGWKPIRDGGAFVGRGLWVDGPIWSQIAVGVACFVVALFAYRRASRDPRLRHHP